MKNVKKTITYIIVVALLVIAALLSVQRIHTLKEQNKVLKENQEVLLQNQQSLVNSYQYNDSLRAVSIARMQLDTKTVSNYCTELSSLCKDLKIRVKDVESATKIASDMVVGLSTPIKDTVFIVNDNKINAKTFDWSDNYVRVDGIINNDSIECNVESFDTIKQIVHIKPKCFLGIKHGVKEIRQEMICTNPHSKITYAEFIDVQRK